MRVSIPRQPKFWAGLLIFLVFMGALVLGVKNLNKPAQGTINQTPPAKAEAQDPYANPSKYKGKYISFTYPAHYKTVPSQLSGPILEVARFHSTDQSSKQISVEVLDENIKDDSGIKLRRSQPGTYQEEPRTASGIVIFNSTASGAERTAFVPHQDKVATISITSPPGWDLTEDMQTIISSLRWN